MGFNERFYSILEGIELERKNEETYYKHVLEKYSKQEKIENGILWQPVNLTHKRYTLGEYIEISIERKELTEKSHRFKVGAGVSFFQLLHNEKIEYKGTVSSLRRHKMKIILHQDVLDQNSIVEKGIFGVELIYDEKPYRVMKKTIEGVIQSNEPHIQILKEGLSKNLPFDHSIPDIDFEINNELNDSQNDAIKGCLSSPNISIVHGPPGTGKTTTIVGLVGQILKSEKQVLVCASSNNAVDLLTYRIAKKGIGCVRLGNITRIDDSILDLTLDEQLRNSKEWSQIKQLKIEADEVSKKANKYKRSFGPEERRERTRLRKEAKEIRKWAKELEYRLTKHLIRESKVVLTTLVGASNEYLQGNHFETCIIDEASQALEAECWIAMTKSNKTILVGDHKQLPPTVKSNEALKLGFDTTLLDLLTDQIKHSYVLKEQYRMNDEILSFPNQTFYQGRLFSNDSNKSIHLGDERTPVEFIDTVGTGFDEDLINLEFSKFNKGEYFVIREHILSISSYLQDKTIGIITPYAAQVKYIKKEVVEDDLLNTLNLSVESIDGFQGQEKDVIYISLVRSNENGQVGFLKDDRRLNVALTRAKRKLIVIGDSATISSHSTLVKLMEHIESTGNYRSAWEFMA